MPLLASFFVSILFFFHVMQVQVEVQKALENTSRELAVCLEEEGTGDFLLAEALFVKNMQTRKTALRSVGGGSLGISLAGSAFNGDEVYLRAEYRIKLPVSIFWKKSLDIVQSVGTRKWVGWKGNKEPQEDSWVYITETGTVYHLNRTCTHLDLSVRMVPSEAVGSMKNANGGSYRCCYKCAGESIAGKQVYITDEGDCYHIDINCSGLKRIVRRVRMSEAAGRRGCSRCAAGGS